MPQARGTREYLVRLRGRAGPPGEPGGQGWGLGTVHPAGRRLAVGRGSDFKKVSRAQISKAPQSQA